MTYEGFLHDMNNITRDVSRSAQAKGRQRRRRGSVTTALLLLLSVAGCDTLLDVELPGDIPSSSIGDPALAGVLANSIQNAFECYFGNYAGGTAVFAGEFITGSQRAGRERWADRSISGTGGGSCRQETWAIEGPGYQALGFGRDVTAQIANWTDAEVDDRQTLLAKVANYTGYTIQTLAEAFCRGVVLEDTGPLVSKNDAHAAAAANFTTALTAAQAANSSIYLNLARVGRARARLNMGDLAGAIADADAVDVGFSFDATFGTVRDRENVEATENWRDRQYSVAPKLRNLDVDGVPDPRVELIDQGYTGIDGQTDIWSMAKMSANDSPIRLASWNEAQLIVAEASLGQEAVDRINAVRALHVLPDYVPVDVNDAAEILNQVLQERERELSFEGHRMGDLTRNPAWAQNGQWIEGVNHLGASFTPNYCLPFPQSEIDSNPNID